MDRSGYNRTSTSDFSESAIDEDRNSSDIIAISDNVAFRRNHYNTAHNHGFRRRRRHHSNELFVTSRTPIEILSSINDARRRRRRRRRYYNRLYSRHSHRRLRRGRHEHFNGLLAPTQSYVVGESSTNVFRRRRRQYERHNRRYNNGHRHLRSEHTEQRSQNNLISYDSNEPLVNNQSEYGLIPYRNSNERTIGQNYSYDPAHILDARRQHTIAVLLATHLNDEPASRNSITTQSSRRRNHIYNGRNNARRLRRLYSSQTEQVGQRHLYLHHSNELLSASPSNNEVTSSSYVNLSSRRYNRYGRQRFRRGRIGHAAQRNSEFDPSNDETVYSSNVPTRRRRSNNRHFLSYNRYGNRPLSRSRSPQAAQRNFQSYHELLTLSEMHNVFPNMDLQRNNDRDNLDAYSDENGHVNHNRLNSLSNDEIASASTSTRHRRQGHQLFWPRRTENRNPSNLSLLIPTDRISEESLPDIVVRLDMDNGDDGPFIWQQQLRSRSGLINSNNANGNDDESIYSEPVPITSEMLHQIYPHILHHLIEQVSPEPFNYNQVIKFYIRNSNVSETDVLYSLITKITADPALRANNVLNQMLGVNPSTDQIETDFSAAGDFNYPILDEDIEIENPDNIEDDLNDGDDRGIIIEIQFPPNEQNNVEVNE